MCNQRQLTMFDVSRRCRGGSCAEVLPDGRHRCLTCGRTFQHYRDGFCNCGVTENTFWSALNDQVEPNEDGTYTVPGDGVMIETLAAAPSREEG